MQCEGHLFLAASRHGPDCIHSELRYRGRQVVTPHRQHNRTRTSMITRTLIAIVTITFGISLLAVAPGVQANVASTPELDSELLAADTPRTTVLGNTFLAPTGWTISIRGRSTILEVPEGGSYIVLFDVPVKNAASGDDAVAAAWAEYKPGASWPLKVTTPIADRDG